MKDLFKKIVVSILIFESKMVLKKYKPKIVAVTGTVGKTSTKDAVYTALSKSLSVRKAKKSQNSDIGLPLTILGCANPTTSTNVGEWLGVLLEGAKLMFLPSHYPEWLVLELGADHPGDIASVTQWVKPDVAVVTRLSKMPVHVEFFPSVEDITKEKSYVIRALKPAGVAVLNADDEDVRAFAALFPGRVITFGYSSEADISAHQYEVVYDDRGAPSGIQFLVRHRINDEGKREEDLVLLKGTLGSHLVYPILAALAVTEAVGENVSAAAKSFRTHEPTPGRMRIVDGVEGSTIIDDTYNSSPIALEEALKTLKGLKGTKGEREEGEKGKEEGQGRSGRRIAVLGDMLELGKYTLDEHKKAGLQASESADVLVTIGQRMSYAAEAARLTGMQDVHEFDDAIQAGNFLQGMIKKGDMILVKGSQSVRAERVVLALMAHPEDKEKLLVRMDEEWKKRG